MLIGIAIGPGRLRNAISANNNAVSEVTENKYLDTVRVKQYVKVNGRLYLVAMECRCKERPGSN